MKYCCERALLMKCADTQTNIGSYYDTCEKSSKYFMIKAESKLEQRKYGQDPSQGS